MLGLVVDVQAFCPGSNMRQAAMRQAGRDVQALSGINLDHFLTQFKFPATGKHQR
ncbi:hypothetical protein D3C81_1854850 [compost metagenome]